MLGAQLVGHPSQIPLLFFIALSLSKLDYILFYLGRI
jgi:hypothetical protein